VRRTSKGIAPTFFLGSYFKNRLMKIPSTEPTAVKIWKWAAANIYECMTVKMHRIFSKQRQKKEWHQPPILKKLKYSKTFFSFSTKELPK
jgi:hypothetical protein